MFALLREAEIGHVSLAQRADLLIIAPATANTIAKLAASLADNMLTATALDTRVPILLAPAMETGMWENPLTQDNVARLQKMRDVTVAGPGVGRLASGGIGPGRMAEPAEIVDWARIILGREGPLAGQRVIVTTSGTQEPIDPVRFVGNHSSGKMGYALALAARDRGARVTLVSAPTALPAPTGVQLVAVQTAEEMRQAVLAALPESDALIMAAAVANYRPAVATAHKIKKSETGLELTWVRTSDILAEVAARRAELGRPRVVVGFAAETQDLLANAQAKLKAKRLDLMVAKVPIVPAAILFDLAIGDPSVRPDAAMGYAACQAASDGSVTEGNVGAGTGATVGKIMGIGQAMKAGLGTASVDLGEGLVVGAIVAVNAFGDAIDPHTGQIIAGARSLDGTGFADTLAVMKSLIGKTPLRQAQDTA